MIVSPPCLSVMMLASAIDLKLNLKPIDYDKKEHHSPEFLKLNPQHTVPTIVDNGFVLWESRAIMIYLLEKYGIDDSLNPRDPETRAVINQRLYFDMGTLYEAVGEVYWPLFEGKSIDPEKFKKLETAIGFLETFLDGHEYVVNNEMTIADISTAVSISCADAFDFDFEPFPKVAKWLATMKEVPGYDEVKRGICKIKEYYEECLKRVE